MILRFAAAVLLALFAQGAGAAPTISSVSGSVASGQAVTINGSGFGTKAPAAPMVWDTFDSGPVGTAIQNRSAVVGTWDSGAGSDNVFYSSTRGYASSAQSARHPFTSSAWNSSLSKNGSYPVLYMEFRRWYDTANGEPSNYKPWRLYGDSDTRELFMGYGCGYQLVTLIGAGVNTSDWGPVGLSGKMGAWQHYQIMFKDGTPSAANGVLKTFLNGVQDGWNTTSLVTRTSSVVFDQIRLGHYFDVGPRDGCTPANPSVMYSDNVYLDTTLARIEIGNASTYAASTHREIQIPSAWSDTSATVTVNSGTFSSGNIVYLYVIDSNDVASPGYQVTIGGGASNPPVLSAVTCNPTSVQSVGTSTCTATLSGGTPTTYTWTTASSGTFCAPSGTNPATYTCQYGGAYQPCLTVSNADGSSGPVCAAQSLSVRYRKPTGLGAN